MGIAIDGDAGNAGSDRERALGRLRRFVHLLDDAFRIPGARIRFGWDPIIGLIPGLGDITTGLLSVIILLQAFRFRIPHVIKMRMLLNLLIDVAVGAVPFVGDLFDFAWRSNSRNLALLEKHAVGGERPGFGDWAFVLGAVVVALAALSLPIIVLILIIGKIEEWVDVPNLWRF